MDMIQLPLLPIVGFACHQYSSRVGVCWELFRLRAITCSGKKAQLSAMELRGWHSTATRDTHFRIWTDSFQIYLRSCLMITAIIYHSRSSANRRFRTNAWHGLCQANSPILQRKCLKSFANFANKYSQVVIRSLSIRGLWHHPGPTVTRSVRKTTSYNFLRNFQISSRMGNNKSWAAARLIRNSSHFNMMSALIVSIYGGELRANHPNGRHGGACNWAKVECHRFGGSYFGSFRCNNCTNPSIARQTGWYVYAHRPIIGAKPYLHWHLLRCNHS